MAAPTGTTYLHPSDTVVNRMFGPVDAGSDDSGLGLVPQQVMRDADSRYVPGDAVACD
jgi:hypothetical protein